MSAVYVGSAAVGLIVGSMGAEASEDASSAQSASSAAGIAEQRRQFDEIRKLLAPYVNVGTPSLERQKVLSGLGGSAAELAAIKEIEKRPGFTEMIRQGESALLQNASATGGLRGGNVQAALARFRPQMLNQAIAQQYERLAGLTSIGQNAAAGVGNAGMQTGSNVANLLQQQGAAIAGGILGQAQGNISTLNAIPQAYGAYRGYTGFGGGSSPSMTTSQTYGTVPGSEQTQMLQAQDAGF